jgi:hypothetical protein
MILVNKTLEKYSFDPQTYKGNSNKICVVKCDYCEKIFERIYHKIIRGRKNINKDSCNKKCQSKKNKEIFLQKYGVEHPSQNEEINNNRKQTFIKKYGVENPFQNEEIKNKIKNTLQNHYGVDNVAHLDKIKKRKKETCLQRYGVEVPIQNEKIRNKIQNTIKEKYGVKIFGYKQRISFPDIEKYCHSKNIIPLFIESEYENRLQKLSFKCLNHNFIFESTLQNISRLEVMQCPKCKSYKSSKYEQEIADFLKLEAPNISFEQNMRNIINGELDFYFPENNLAIEFHGLYWHSEIFKSKQYHYNKFIQCKEKNIQLFQIYEDEWRDKKEIWKSIIRNKLKICKNKHHARKCIVNDSPHFDKVKKFLEENHLQGFCNYKKAITLEDNEKNIISCITLRKPFTKKEKHSIEIARFCNFKNSIVHGSFSKLIKYVIDWSIKNKYIKILTYSDCRYSFGNIYENNNFKLLKHTGIGYDYTNFNKRFGRFIFRAKNNKSEIEIASMNDVYKIYNSGNYLWKYEIYNIIF